MLTAAPSPAEQTRSVLAELRLRSAEETNDFAQRLAVGLGAADVLCLDGNLGAGKTHFARATIQHLLAKTGQYEDVPSPSFTLVQTYHAGGLEIWHSDLYRLSDPQELDELGLTDAFSTALCLIEWPGRMAEDMPQDALWLSFRMVAEDENARELSISSSDPEKWRARIARLVQ